MSHEQHTTDDNCQGYCRCPTCDGPAHWSFVHKQHACADPECATIFREHDDTQFTEAAQKGQR